MIRSPLLAHSNKPDDDFYTTFVRPATSDELSRKTVDADGFPIVPVKFADKSKKLVFVDNPIVTDVTQTAHTDIQHILNQNPDISGLSLLLDDPAADSARDCVQLEDFIQPSQYVDIFDIQEFVEQSKRSFNMLPAAIRKQFNNNPANLVSALDSKDSSALASLYEYLRINPESKSASPGDVSEPEKTASKSSTKSSDTSSSSNVD